MNALAPRPVSSYTIEDQRRMTRAKHYFAWQARLVRPELGRRVLEIGCGIGNFTALLEDREAVIAIDSDPDCIAIHKSRFPAVHAFSIDAASEAMQDLASFRPDSCVFLNVLEHIEDDLGALRRVSAILPARAPVVILAPAFPALAGPIDRNLGHYRRYSRRSIRQLAYTAGLRIRTLRYVNALGFFGWWTNAHILRRQAQSETQIKIFDALAPLLSRLESIVPPPFGQSIFAVLEKPD